jgi:hypothetical protein
MQQRQAWDKLFPLTCVLSLYPEVIWNSDHGKESCHNMVRREPILNLNELNKEWKEGGKKRQQPENNWKANEEGISGQAEVLS